MAELLYYYEADKLYVYPSSNATDGGRNHTEYNVSQIPYTITQRNFVLRKPELALVWVNEDNPSDGVKLTSGYCSIHGYKFEITQVLTFSSETLSSMNESNELPPEGTYHIYFKLGRDTQYNLLSDINDASRFSFKAAECLQVILSTDKLDESDPEILYLGYIIWNGLSVENYWNNPRKYFCIDWTQIEVYDTSITDDTYPYMSLEEYLDLFRMRIYQYMDTHYIRKDIDDYALGRIHFYNTAVFEEGFISGDSIINSLKIRDVVNYEYDENEADIRNQLSLYDENNSMIDITAHSLSLSKGLYDQESYISFESPTGSSDITLSPDFNEENSMLYISSDLSAVRVHNAIWNDYAEFFRKANPNEYIEAGDLVSSNGIYAYKTKDPNDNLVIGVCTNSYGMILGGSNKVADNYRTHVAVAMCGQVKVKIQGQVSPGDLLISAGNGYAKRISERDHDIIGRCTTNYTHEYEVLNRSSDDTTEMMTDTETSHIPEGDKSINHNTNDKTHSRFRFLTNDNIDASFNHPDSPPHNPNPIFYNNSTKSHFKFDPCNGECHVARIIGKYLGDDSEGNHIMQVFLD